MPKRKRGEDGEVAAVGNGKLDPVEKKRREVEENIVNGRKLLRRALVTAKAFEWKKLGKRIKAAAAKRNGTAEVARLQKEADILKNLDLSEVAATHLYKTLLKVKRIVETETLPKYVSAIQKSSVDDETMRKARENVTARLYNFKPVKENMTYVVGTIYAVLGIRNDSQGSKGPATSSTPADTKKEKLESIERENSDQSEDDDEDSFGPFEEETDNQNIGHPESEDSEDYSQYGDFLAASSDEESEDQSSDDELERPTERPRKTIKSRGLSVSVSGSSRSPSPSISLSGSPEPEIKDRTKQPAKTTKPDSTFLPSLMGGYWSGSEEFDSDDEDAGQAPRKNRPGQRARQAIWEKKYGKRAKHLQKVVWDPKRGAVGPDDKRSRKKGDRRGFSRNTAKVTGENAVPVKPRARQGEKKAEGPLHPSWEAKKKAKEAQKTATFKGSKVVFD